MITGSQAESAFSIQRANTDHASLISKLVQSSGINPSGLDWRRFLVAILPTGELIGCGQIKPHADGTLELASLAVEPRWRNRGVARDLIEALLASHSGELYLMCQSHLGSLYEKFGFRILSGADIPTYFRRVSKLAGVQQNLTRVGESLLIMRRSAQ